MEPGATRWSGASGRLWPILLAIVTTTACNTKDDDDTGIPQPWPIPIENKLRSTTAVTGMPKPVHLIGLPGAVEKPGTVIVNNGEASVEAEATEGGSFSLFIEAQEGDELEVRLETSEPVKYMVPPSVSPPMPPAPPGPIDGVTPVSPASEGKVQVRGSTGDATAVIVVNIDGGDVVSTDRDSKGEFTVEIGGASGETLHVYADKLPLEGAWTVEIP